MFVFFWMLLKIIFLVIMCRVVLCRCLIGFGDGVIFSLNGVVFLLWVLRGKMLSMMIGG